MGVLTYQPFKGIYALSALGFELARFPLWLVKYVLKYGRQHPDWSFRQALAVRVLFSAVWHQAAVQVQTPLPLAPGKEKERFVVVKPAPATFYKGPLVSDENVTPGDVGATWYRAPLSTASDLSNVTVVLHIHGGAFVIADGRTGASGDFANYLLKNTGATHAFFPQYRLSTLPASKTSNPFPACIQDSLTAYLYLIKTLKIAPKDIILSGDSAGGNAAISLLKYMAEYGADLGIPVPSAAWLWSPWINPADDTDEFTRSNPNYKTDYLSYPFTKWGSNAYAGLGGKATLSSPYVSFKGRPFRTDVPIWVNTGSAEVLYFDDVEWTKAMEEAGNNVTLDVERNVPHDILLFPGTLGFGKQANACAKRAGEWAKSVRK